MKLWAQENVAHEPGAPDATVADAKRRINALNNQRNDLIQELDELLDKAIKAGYAPIFPSFKDYSRK
jgi:hypothetical protein